jgi:hypothetical protein
MSTAGAVQAAARRSGRARLPVPSLRVAVPVACLALSAALWLSAAAVSVDPRELGDTGLGTALPPVVIAAAIVLCGSFVATLRTGLARTWLLAAHVVLLILVLQGTPALIEDVSRFSVTWRHLGVVESIARTEALHPEVDAYFNWPGFFALAALVFRVLGIDDPGAAVAWSSAALGLAYLAPLLVVARHFLGRGRAAWLAVWIFYLANWVGQDYFSPQGLTYLAYLVVVGLVLTGVEPGATNRPARLACAGFLVAVTVPTHQLTPLVLGIALAVVAVVYRSRAVALLAVVTFGLVGLWLATGARTFVDGHLGELVEDLGALGSTVESSLGGRIEGSPGHLLVLETRIGVATFVVALAVAGAIVLLRAQGRTRRWLSLCALAVAPLALLALQAYGGEIGLRAYFFALPFLAVLAAGLLAGREAAAWDASRTAALGLVTLALLAAYPLTRYGNERLDAFTSSELRAVEAVYRAAPSGSTLVTLAEEGGPWKFRNYELYHYRTLGELPEWPGIVSGRIGPRALVAALERERAGDERVFVVLLRSQLASVELLEGTRTRALERAVEQLERSGRLHTVLRNPDATVLELERR